MAAQIFGVPEAEVTADQRRVAKTVNFGVIYGISPTGLAQRLEISREEAAKFIDSYFARYPQVQEYQAPAEGLPRRTATWPRSSAGGGSSTARPSAPNSTYQQRNQPSARRSTWRCRARPPT